MNNINSLILINYLAPGCSYNSFLKAYDTEQQKGHFPYEYIDSIEKLEETELPPYESFWSNLKQAYTCTTEEYLELQQIWIQEKFSNHKGISYLV